jgi:hypothetical protein
MIAYIEDILHYYVDTIGVEDADKPILTSISRQCKKGIALTDRQYELVKSKLLNKQELLVDVCLEGNLTPRLPLRQIDRSKYIAIVSHGEMLGDDSVYESYKENWVWIKVRFPFAKKLIAKLDNVKTKVNQRHQYYHVKGSHEHYFKLKGDVVYWLVNAFSNSNFEIEDRVIEYYNASKQIIENSSNYRIEYAEGKFKNLPDKVVSEVASLSQLCIADRQIRYGYTIENVAHENTLQEQIAYREHADVYIDPTLYSITQIANSINLLDRFPMVVLIDNDSQYDQVAAIHQAFDFVDNSLQSVLFRVDTESTYNLNDYIKEHSLNNWVDKNTKIVYIKKNQLPKVMLSSNFRPVTAFAINSYRSNTMVENYIKFNCDLIVYHDVEKSILGRYSRQYGLL